MKKILLSILMLCCMTAAWAEGDGFVTVASAEQMWNAIKASSGAKIKLTDDIYLSDINKDGETFCSTFTGTIDGDGHTVYGDHYGDNSTKRRSRTYLFTYSDGATFKNLTFKYIRVDNRGNHNQGIITSQAKNGCVFENITFDQNSTYVGDEHDNTGAVAGYATTNCTFKNITVKNSDFTADNCQSGAVVGHAMNCTFTNIKVENCESTARTSYSGGVAGRTDNCTINNVEILGSFIKTHKMNAGGVAGYSENTQFTNCVVDDQSCVCAGEGILSLAYAGGIVGRGEKSKISNCINSALVAANDDYAGGIIGSNKSSNIVGCLNTGMVIAIEMSKVNDFYTKYKTKTGMTCVTKNYQGKEYVIRKYGDDYKSYTYFGGIAGYLESVNVSKCVNFGSVYSGSSAVGGIAGHIKGGIISDCLSDFSGAEDIYGICLFEATTTSTNGAGSDGRPGNPGPGIYEKTIYEVSIDNCLNMTTYKDFAAYSNWKNFSSSDNNYSLTTAEDAHHTNKTTAAMIKSGAIGARLGTNWEQHLDIDPYPTPTGNRGLYYTRTVSNEYGTVCLPFALKSNEDIAYYRFNPDVKTEGGSVVLEFRKTETVDAGEPVLFRASKTGELTFSNAGNTYSDLPHNTAMVDVPWAIVGVYEQQVFDETTYPSSDHVYYVSNGEIRNAKTVTIAPYRAWIGGPRIYELTGSSAKAIRIVVEDEDGTTSIITPSEWSSLPSREGWGGSSYSLMGTEVGEGYRGIVIKNGKKYLRK